MLPATSIESPILHLTESHLEMLVGCVAVDGGVSTPTLVPRTF